MARFSASFVTHRGHVREHNEDNGLIDQVLTPQGLYHVWAVADGMGGLARGEVASETALSTLGAELRARLPVAEPAMALGDAIGRANSNVYSAGKGAMGTTITAAIVHDASGRTWIGHIGDSRAYVTSGRGITQITDDHSKVGEAMRAGFLTEEEAFTTTGRNVLTRALGSDPEVAVDISGPHTLAPGEHLLLCSDGVHGMLRDRDILAVLRPDQEGGPARVLDASLQAGGKDNITVLLGGLAEVAPVTVAGVPAHRPKRKPAAANRPTLMPVIAAGAAGVFVLAIIGTVFGLTRGGGNSTLLAGGIDPESATGRTIVAMESTKGAGGSININDLAALYTQGVATSAATSQATNSPTRSQQGAATSVPPTSTWTPTKEPSAASPTRTAIAIATTVSPTPTLTPANTPTPTSTPTSTPTPTITPTPTPLGEAWTPTPIPPTPTLTPDPCGPIPQPVGCGVANPPGYTP